jgi:hypothetical protein
MTNDNAARDPQITLDQIAIPLTLSAAMVNTILKHLGTGVYTEVAPVISLIKQQGDPVLNDAVARMSKGAMAAVSDSAAPDKAGSTTEQSQARPQDA